MVLNQRIAARRLFMLKVYMYPYPHQVEKQTCEYVKKVFSELGSPNKCNVKMEHGGNWWVTDINEAQYVAGRNATKRGEMH